MKDRILVPSLRLSRNSSLDRVQVKSEMDLSTHCGILAHAKPGRVCLVFRIDSPPSTRRSHDEASGHVRTLCERWNNLSIVRLIKIGDIISSDRMAERAADQDTNDPVTLHRIMQTMIGEGLKTRYRPPRKLSHEIFVLLLQLKEEERRHNGAAPPRKGVEGAGKNAERAVPLSRALSASR